MNPDDASRLERVFDALLGVPRDEWEAVVQAECRGDAELSREALSLLQAAESGETYLSGLAQRIGLPTAPDRPDGMVGRMIGPYRLVRLLGRGGMGVVYLAERRDGDFTVRAAVKLLPTGMLSRDAKERFRAERRILSGLSHPNIARLFDGGITEDGTPFFVMEYVDGRPIDTYCDEAGLSVRERVRLFLTVCAAVQYAHESLVIHRDLKADNVLVGREGEVKLLDFGIARVIATAGTGFVTRTMAAHPITMAHASPEQVEGRALTTAADVYGLGVLLYRLVTGCHPYPLEGLPLRQAEEVILSRMPTPPAEAVKAEAGPAIGGNGANPVLERAQLRRTTPQRLRKELAGDLSSILSKALRKEPGRRYRGVAELAEELQRYLLHLPVSARPDTLGYRARRFVRRHRGGVATAAVIGLLGASLGVVSVRYALDTRAQARRIVAEAALSEEVFDLFVNALGMADPSAGGGDTLTVRAALARVVEAQQNRLENRPDLRSRLLERAGQAYGQLGLDEDAERLFLESLELVDTADPGADSILGVRHARLAELYRDRGRFRDAMAEYVSALGYYDKARIDSVLAGHAHLGLAQALLQLKLTDSARVEGALGLGIVRRHASPSDTTTLKATIAYATVLRAFSELDSAIAMVEEVVRRGETLDPVPGNVLAPALNNLGVYHRLAADYASAEADYRRALERYGDWIPLSERQTVMVNLATLRKLQGDTTGALSILRERVELAEQWWPDGNWRVGNAWNLLGNAHVQFGDLAAAERPLRNAVTSYTATLGPDHSWTANAESLLGGVLWHVGRTDEGEQYLLTGYEKLRSSQGPEAPWSRDAAARLADFYEAQGRPTSAARYRGLASG